MGNNKSLPFLPGATLLFNATAALGTATVDYRQLLAHRMDVWCGTRV